MASFCRWRFWCSSSGSGLPVYHLTKKTQKMGFVRTKSCSSIFLDLPKVAGTILNIFPPNGGETMVIYHGRIRKKSHNKNKTKLTKGLLTTMIP